MLDIFPAEIKKALSRINLENVYELRLRINKPISLNILGKICFLSPKGQTMSVNEAIILSKEDMEVVFYSACEHSVFSVNDNIKQGFLTLDGGYRIGITGEIVYDKNEIHTIKNISSLNIRIPHQITGCAEIALNYCLTNSFENTLIISPPGAGKTTVLRDLAYQISKNNIAYNLMIIDERNEISNTINGVSNFNVGLLTDVITNSSKTYGFDNAIRTMRPDIIFTDEIGSNEDISSLRKAYTCGIKIVATIHANSIQDLKNKKELSELLEHKVFRRYVLLSVRNGVGTYEGIYDENFKLLYREM